MKAAAMLAVVLAASGCASHGGNPSSISTRLKAGQSWLITRPILAAQVLHACTRDISAEQGLQVDAYWAPSRQQIEQLEASQPALQPRIAQPADFDRQYVGIHSRGRQMIYINAFRLSELESANPAKQAIQACNGEQQYWNAVYDPQTGEFSDMQSNGVPQPIP